MPVCALQSAPGAQGMVHDRPTQATGFLQDAPVLGSAVQTPLHASVVDEGMQKSPAAHGLTSGGVAGVRSGLAARHAWPAATFPVSVA
jgi:hypothetical protein